MVVIMAKHNQEVVKKVYPKTEFKDYGKHLSVFYIHGTSFKALIKQVKAQGFNPYALFTW